MPVYEYRCKKCNVKFEKFVRSLSAQNAVQCPRCGSEEVEKAVSLFGVGNRSRSAASSCTTGSV
ncbi:MAG TPA: zinc ribbon domain-containing protein [Chloroflexi bacterium]|nr:zinc ribbon domain-containing protein [Chloroflexota bacterium]